MACGADAAATVLPPLLEQIGSLPWQPDERVEIWQMGRRQLDDQNPNVASKQKSLVSNQLPPSVSPTQGPLESPAVLVPPSKTV